MMQQGRRRFIVLTAPRSGSTWVGTMLRSHSAIVTFGEIFYPLVPRKKQHKRHHRVERWNIYVKHNGSGLLGYLKRPFILHKYLDELYNSAAEDEHVAGFKLMFKQMLRHPGIVFYILRRRVAVIRLTRRNHLDIVISQATKEVRDIAHSVEDVQQIQVRLDPRQTVRRIKSLRFWDRLIDLFCYAIPVPVLKVAYEDLRNDPAEWERILDFLGLPPGADGLCSPHKKLNTLPQKRLIDNYEDLASALKKAGMEYYLREVRPRS